MAPIETMRKFTIESANVSISSKMAFTSVSQKTAAANTGCYWNVFMASSVNAKMKLLPAIK